MLIPIGTFVRHRANGPLMLVVGTAEDNKAICELVTDGGELKTLTTSPSSLLQSESDGEILREDMVMSNFVLLCEHNGLTPRPPLAHDEKGEKFIERWWPLPQSAGSGF